MIDTSDVGAVRLLAEYAEATRAHFIFASNEARARPAEAWFSLPLGLSVGDAMAHLAGLPQAPDDEVHQAQLELLRVRRASALTKWRMYQLGRLNAHSLK